MGVASHSESIVIHQQPTAEVAISAVSMHAHFHDYDVITQAFLSASFPLYVHTSPPYKCFA